MPYQHWINKSLSFLSIVYFFFLIDFSKLGFYGKNVFL